MDNPPTAASDTPIGKNRRSQAANQRASGQHLVSDSVKSNVMDEYIERVLASFPAWKTIAADPRVRAAREVLLAVSPSAHERSYYAPTTKLLNLISLGVFDAYKDSRAFEDQPVACIFTSRPDNAPPGDIFHAQIRPDYPSFFGTHLELLSAVTVDNYVPVRLIPWPETGSTGEQKPTVYGHRKGTGQFKTYIITHFLYRPDMPTVYGILVSRGYIQVSQLNACSSWSSSPARLRTPRKKRRSGMPLPETDDEIATCLAPWIAFVYLVYRSYDQRDRKLSYDAQQVAFPRWDVVDAAGPSPSKSLCLTPFYSAPAPGRATFAAFQVADTALGHSEAHDAFMTSEVRGFWKTSWQQSRGSKKEREILDHLHGPDRWIPGLVRVYPLDKGKRLQVPVSDDIVRQARDADQAKQSTADAGDSESPSDDKEQDASREDEDEEAVGNSDGDEDDSADGDSEYIPDDDDDKDDDDVLDTEALTGISEANVHFVDRDQEILHIASIGEPLSQCETPRELLYTMYDLLETYDNLLEEDIMHRDVSWFNVMCKPRHHRGGNPETQDRPCIRKIMYEALDRSDGKPSVSSVLLADLDHAVHTKETNRDSILRERTGTPMFISIELSDFKCAVYRPTSKAVWEETLIPALTAVDKPDSRGRPLLLAAFPKGDGNFMANLLEVRTRELARRASVKLPERPIHSPRHDGESIFWVYLWAFLRARPRGAAAETNDALRSPSTLCRNLLAHEIGNANTSSDSNRMLCFHCPDMLGTIFHSELAGFEGLFIAMVSYLQIPWHLYSDFVKPNHVQVAFRRMVLGYVVDEKLLAALDLALDTECPRPILQDDTGKPKERKHAGRSDSVAGGTGRSGVTDELQPPEDPKSSRKRKATGQPGSGSAPKKRAGPGKKPVQQAADGSDDANQPKLAANYSHDLHLNDRSAHALRLKVWKDRNLWFSKGT